MEVKGAVAIVTGGGTGIGKATALLLAERGAKVIVCGRRSAPLADTVRLIEEKNGEALAIPTDVRDWAQVREMTKSVLERFGKVDILVNNAGVATAKCIEKTTLDEWDVILNTNLKGVFSCCKSVLPSMVEACNGVIINVSSILGKTGIANFGAYCASKFGVIGLTQALADEFKRRGIRIHVVCPGRTATDMQRQLGGDRIAELSMPSEKVAEKILGLITGEIRLTSGRAVIINEESLGLVLHEAKEKWQLILGQRLKPVMPVLRRIKHLIRSHQRGFLAKN